MREGCVVTESVWGVTAMQRKASPLRSTANARIWRKLTCVADDEAGSSSVNRESIALQTSSTN